MIRKMVKELRSETSTWIGIFLLTVIKADIEKKKVTENNTHFHVCFIYYCM